MNETIRIPFEEKGGGGEKKFYILKRMLSFAVVHSLLIVKERY